MRHIDRGASRGQEPDLPLARLDGAQDAPRRRGLAATALTNEGKRLSAGDTEADIVHGLHLPDNSAEQTTADRVMLAKLADLQHGDFEYGRRVLIHHAVSCP